MYLGPSSLSLDAKGRLSVPTRHRDALGATASGQLTITKHPDGCLWLFPRPEWEKFRDKLMALPMSAQGIKRIFLGHAMEVEMDGTGRVLVAPELRAAAGIEKDALLLAIGNHFELWNPATYAAAEAAVVRNEKPGSFQDMSF